MQAPLCSHLRQTFISQRKASIRSFKRLYSSKPNFAVRSKINVFSISLLAIPVSTFCLGTWQIRRREWKLKLIKILEEKQKGDPVPLPINLDELEEMEHEKVTVRGKFNHKKEIYISPRSKIIDHDSAQSGGGLLSNSSNIGSNVITPFQLEDRDLTIMVNRGWVPRDKAHPRSRRRGQIDDVVDLCGIVRKTDKQTTFMPKNNPASKIWYFRDVDAMAMLLDCQPVFIDADTSSTVEGGPIGGQSRVSLRNEHMTYIITWYSLSAITAYMWFMRFLR